MQIPTRPGWIEAIFGPMFSGKTEELIRRLLSARYGKGEVQVFRPSRDGRSTNGQIETHGGWKLPATAVENPYAILEHITPTTTVIGIDEAQFFDPDDLAGICEQLAKMERRVIIAGLDLDFRGQPFGWFARLVGQAESATKLTAHCALCGQIAVFSQRIDGTEQQIEVGGPERYSPRCRHCFTPR